jgi:tetratricopeptide (TPR) repeat protein
MEEKIKQIMQLALGEKWDEARQLIQKVLESDSGNLEARVLQADIETIAGNEQEAFKQLRAILREYPEYGPAYYSMGVCHSRQGRWDQAKTFFEKSISKLEPDQAESLSDAYLQLGVSCWEQRHRDEAMESWKKSLAFNPAQWKAREYLEEFTSDYSQPKILGEPELFQEYQTLQVQTYLNSRGKSQFDTLEETNEVIRKIVSSWNAIPDKWKVEDLSPEERLRLFKTVSPF